MLMKLKQKKTKNYLRQKINYNIYKKADKNTYYISLQLKIKNYEFKGGRDLTKLYTVVPR